MAETPHLAPPLAALTEPPAPVDPRLTAKRIGLASATMIVSVNAWTGAPLLALWVGSRVQNGAVLSMMGVFSVVVTLVAVEMVLLAALTWLSARDDRLTGRPAVVRRKYPWNSSLRGESDQIMRRARGVSLIARTVILGVVAAAIEFEIWFLFLAGSSLPGA